jgi:hypothetical protein
MTIYEHLTRETYAGCHAQTIGNTRLRLLPRSSSNSSRLQYALLGSDDPQAKVDSWENLINRRFPQEDEALRYRPFP